MYLKYNSQGFLKTKNKFLLKTGDEKQREFEIMVKTEPGRLDLIKTGKLPVGNIKSRHHRP